MNKKFLANQRSKKIRKNYIALGKLTRETKAELIAAYKAKDWDELDYDSWESYFKKEFSDVATFRLSREEIRELNRQLAREGMTERDISVVSGVSDTTVHRDIQIDRASDEASEPAMTREDTRSTDPELSTVDIKKLPTTPKITISDEELLSIKRSSLVSDLLSNASHALSRLNKFDAALQNITFELSDKQRLQVIDYLERFRARLASIEEHSTDKVSFSIEIEEFLK